MPHQFPHSDRPINAEHLPSFYLDNNILIDIYERTLEHVSGPLLSLVCDRRLTCPFSAEMVDEFAVPLPVADAMKRLGFLAHLSEEHYFENSAGDIGFTKRNPFDLYDMLKEQHVGRAFKAELPTLVTFENLEESRKQLGLSRDSMRDKPLDAAIESINAAIFQYAEDDCRPGLPRNLSELAVMSKEIYQSKQISQNQVAIKGVVEQIPIVMLFSLLDSLGYGSDKKSIYQKGSQYSDGSHCFCASHYDFLVTRDKGMRTKGEAVYQILGIETKVIGPCEFEELVISMAKT
jgi:hypothetical protein